MKAFTFLKLLKLVNINSYVQQDRSHVVNVPTCKWWNRSSTYDSDCSCATHSLRQYCLSKEKGQLVVSKMIFQRFKILKFVENIIL